MTMRARVATLQSKTPSPKYSGPSSAYRRKAVRTSCRCRNGSPSSTTTARCWPEYPLIGQLAFVLAELQRCDATEPESADEVRRARARLRELLTVTRLRWQMQIRALADAGMTTDEFRAGVTAGSHRAGIRRTSSSTTRSSTSRCWSSCVTCGRVTSRPSSSRWRRGLHATWVEGVSASRPSRWSARPRGRPSSCATADRRGEDARHLFVDDKAGKPSAFTSSSAPADRLFRQQRRRPGDAAIHHDRQPAPAASASSSTIPTARASSPTTPGPVGRARRGADGSAAARLDGREHEGRLENRVSVRDASELEAASRAQGEQDEMTRPRRHAILG